MRTLTSFNCKSSKYFGVPVQNPLSVPGTPSWEPNLPPRARGLLAGTIAIRAGYFPLSVACQASR